MPLQSCELQTIKYMLQSFLEKGWDLEKTLEVLSSNPMRQIRKKSSLEKMKV